MSPKLIADSPINEPSEDALNVACGLAKKLYRSLAVAQPPFVFGLLGDWGTGKSSTLRLLEYYVNESLQESRDPILIPIVFDAWKYESESNMLLPLVYAFKTKYKVMFGEEAPDSFQKSIASIIGATALNVLDLGLRTTTKAATGEALTLADVKENVETVFGENQTNLDKNLAFWFESVQSTSENFSNFVNDFAKKIASSRQVDPATVRFLVILDDLDRCLPTTVISILEGVRNHLSVDACLYILSMNPAVVSQGIKSKYGGLEIGGREYLEKILNYSVYVPSPLPEACGAFVKNQLSTSLGETDRNDVSSDVWNNLSDVEKAITECQITNPRKIKRIINTIYLILVEMPKEGMLYDLGNLVRLSVLQEYCPRIFLRLQSSDRDFLPAIHKVVLSHEKLDLFKIQYGVNYHDEIELLRDMSGVIDLIEITACDLRAHALAVQSIGVFH